jgi:hypothetical protein
MTRTHAILIFIAAIFFSASAYASFEQLTDELQSKERAIDAQHLAGPALSQTLDANCDVNSALKSVISGEKGGFTGALVASEDRLRTVAKLLPIIAEKGPFNKAIKVGKGVLGLPSVNGAKIETAQDVLLTIAKLANASADAIAKLRDGKGGVDEFSLVIDNSTAITQLVTTFYSISSS